MENNGKSDEESVVYKLIEDKNICILAFRGNFNSKSRQAIEEVTSKILNSKCDTFILNFKGVERIDRTTHRLLMGIQLVIKKDLGAQLRVCELKPGIRSELVDFGIVKQFEYYPTLREALLDERLK